MIEKYYLGKLKNLLIRKMAHNLSKLTKACINIKICLL